MDAANSFIPVHEPLLAGNELRYLTECVESGWVSCAGPFVKRFEEQMAARLGRRHAVAVSSGGAALSLAAGLLDIGPGDEVIMPAFTIISCAAAVVRQGGVPVLVDADPQRWTMRVDQIERRLTPRTRAIMAVHIYGLPADMGAVLAIARRHGLRVIEDAAEAIAQPCAGGVCGGLGDISALSFYPNKHVTTGEGGMLLMDDAAMATRARSLRNEGLRTGRERFVHEELGWSVRLSNLQAAVGLAQAERLDATLAAKRRVGLRYTELLADLPSLQLPVAGAPHADNYYQVYGVALRDEAGRDAGAVMQALRERGIDTRPFFHPLHQQPALLRRGLFAGERHPASEWLGGRGFYLPSGAAITDERQQRVARALHDVLQAR